MRSPKAEGLDLHPLQLCPTGGTVSRPLHMLTTNLSPVFEPFPPLCRFLFSIVTWRPAFQTVPAHCSSCTLLPDCFPTQFSLHPVKNLFCFQLTTRLPELSLVSHISWLSLPTLWRLTEPQITYLMSPPCHPSSTGSALQASQERSVSSSPSSSLLSPSRNTPPPFPLMWVLRDSWVIV